MNKYQKSEKHLNNARIAQKKALETLQQLTKKRIDEYYENPKCCLNCNCAIKYEKKRIDFAPRNVVPCIMRQQKARKEVWKQSQK